MKDNLIRVVSLVVLVVCLAVNFYAVHGYSLQQNPEYSEDFEDGQAMGWVLEPCWQIIDDGGNQVLAGEGHQWAHAERTFEDYHLKFRLKLIKGSIHLVYRINDEGRYFIGFDSSGSKLNKQYWPNTFLENLVSKNVQHATNTWHQVEPIGQGDKLTFLVDGMTEWSNLDSQPILYGSFAFEMLDNSHVFDPNTPPEVI